MRMRRREKGDEWTLSSLLQGATYSVPDMRNGVLTPSTSTTLRLPLGLPGDGRRFEAEGRELLVEQWIAAQQVSICGLWRVPVQWDRSRAGRQRVGHSEGTRDRAAVHVFELGPTLSGERAAGCGCRVWAGRNESG